MPSMSDEGAPRLRSRRPAADFPVEKVAPIDSNEQARIVREFQLEKMKQDALWKHALAVLYTGSAFLLLLILACSVLFGCAMPSEGIAASSPMAGPRCTYFALPSSLWRATRSPLLVNCILAAALALITLWAVYSYLYSEAALQTEFNERKAASSTAASNTSGAAADSSPPLPALPLAPGALARVQLLGKAARGGALAWLCGCLLLAALHVDPNGLGLLVWPLLAWPLVLAGLSLIAAQWSADLEQQIKELGRSQYSYHEL